MMKKKTGLIIGVLVLLLLVVACNSNSIPSNAPVEKDPVVIEPGFSEEELVLENPDDAANTLDEEGNVADNTDENAFVDKGEASTVADVIANQSRIDSYYFEQTLEYPGSSVFMEISFCEDKMRVITYAEGYIDEIIYYDYRNMTITSHFPGMGDNAMMMDFDIYSPDAPENPVLRDYSACELLGQESIDDQLCLLLQTPEGSKLWVSTKDGFPLQAEFEDSLGIVLNVQYKNISLNTVSLTDVEIPQNLVINNMSTGGL